MSDNKYNPSKPSKFSPADQKIRDMNLASQAKQLLKNKFNPEPTDPVGRLLLKAEDLCLKVHGVVKPILQAGGYSDKLALRHMIITMFLEAFDSKLFTREEVIQLCALIHTDIFMESIESDPGGKGKPDLLSGK